MSGFPEPPAAARIPEGCRTLAGGTTPGNRSHRGTRPGRGGGGVAEDTMRLGNPSRAPAGAHGEWGRAIPGVVPPAKVRQPSGLTRQGERRR